MGYDIGIGVGVYIFVLNHVTKFIAPKTLGRVKKPQHFKTWSSVVSVSQRPNF